MLHTGKLLACELYDDMQPPYTNVRAVWEARHSRHPGRCVVTNAHWYDPGPKQCGNYKVGGVVLSNQWPGALTGFGWNTGEPQWTSHMENYENFICTIPALAGGKRQSLNYGLGVERATTRTWFGRKADGEWCVEVTTANYTLDGIVDRMEALGITDGMVLDGSGSSQLYDGEMRITGDGRTIYSYLLCWFAEEEGEKEEDKKPVTYRKGIDVSKWQGAIDWEAVKADGVEFAMLRAGYGQGNIDEQFYRNADECTRLGIPFGVYWFSYAYTEAMARREAEHCLEVIKPYKLSYPVAWDYEYDSMDYATERGIKITKTLVSAMARAFLNKVEEAGYYGALYANPNYLAQYFDADLPKRYDIWLAKWPYTVPGPDTLKPEQCGGIWQYTSSGSVDGINGRVDMNYAYYDYPALTGFKPSVDEPEDEPEVDKPVDYETEKALAREWVKELGISDGERGGDGVTREEMWVMLYRLIENIGG